MERLVPLLATRGKAAEVTTSSSSVLESSSIFLFGILEHLLFLVDTLVGITITRIIGAAVVSTATSVGSMVSTGTSETTFVTSIGTIVSSTGTSPGPLALTALSIEITVDSTATLLSTT